jgi:hypothetical protein
LLEVAGTNPANVIVVDNRARRRREVRGLGLLIVQTGDSDGDPVT